MFGFFSLTYAGTQKGTVAAITKRSTDGLLYFTLNGPATGKPACASWPYWMIKDENSMSGMQQLALILMAKKSASVVTVHGTGTCERWGDGEDVYSIVFE
ncbi:hypothetical protein EJO50_00740 [Iodobacter ciconiae]|uniref:Uncharacterized protein n=2 Tax=Iodobacter ciconiae TaxID=2496266 RepID=A0A3S8ZX63_9NEIS|nr:hypothetical protein EJO50_00740 [Iodobacter ciconiae]